MAPQTINRDDFDWEKRGRAVKEGHERLALKIRTGHMTGSKVLQGGGSASGSSAGGTSRESVLKVIGWSKTGFSAVHQARYVGRQRDADLAADDQRPETIELETETGARLSGRAAIDAEIATWNLTPDHLNRSKAWRDATPEDRTAMALNDSLRKRQTGHMIFSIPARAQHDHKSLEAAVRQGLSETLGAQGFRYVFGIHTDHSARPHAHIIFKAHSEPIAQDPKSVKQIRLNPRELDAMRTVLTQAAREHGLDVIATRRADRQELREKVRAGAEPLHQNQTRGQTWARSKQGGIFATKAPAWYALHGVEYERRRLTEYDKSFASFVSKPEPETKSRPKLFGRLQAALRPAKTVETDTPSKTVSERPTSPALSRLDRFFGQTHQDPVAARESFLALYAEAPKLATWAANKHPAAFGQATGQKPDKELTGRGLKSLISPQDPGAASEKTPTPTLRLERQELLEAKRRLHVKAAAERDRTALQRTLERFADRVVAESTDSRAGDQAAAVREVARQGSRETSEVRTDRPTEKAAERLRGRDPVTKRPDRDPDR